MRNTKSGTALVALAAALLLGACASSDIGDILGGPSGRAPNQIKGIVRSVDTRSGDCRIELDNVSASSSYLNNGGGGYGGGYGGGNRASIYCDDRTRVVFQGQTFRPDSLENGDEVIAQVSDTGGRLIADRIDVTYDVSSGNRGNDPYGGSQGSPYPQDDRSGGYGSYGRAGNEDVRGTVRRLDRENRTLILERVEYYNRSFDRSGSELLTLYYDNQTRVSFRGQSYQPENLEPGDVVAVTVDQVRGTLVASDIQVLGDARDTASYPR